LRTRKTWSLCRIYQRRRVAPYAVNPLPPLEEQSGRGAGFLLFQVVLSGLIVVVFLLLNTFQPAIYRSITQYLKTEFAVSVDFRQDGEQAAQVLKQVFGKCAGGKGCIGGNGFGGRVGG